MQNRELEAEKTSLLEQLNRFMRAGTMREQELQRKVDVLVREFLLPPLTAAFFCALVPISTLSFWAFFLLLYLLSVSFFSLLLSMSLLLSVSFFDAICASLCFCCCLLRRLSFSFSPVRAGS